jgi:hypothetical protein
VTREPGDLPSSAVTCERVGRGVSARLGCVTYAIGQLAVTDGCREDFVPDTYFNFPNACGSDTARRFLMPFLLLIAGCSGWAGNAAAHGIAGNRLFVGTLSFDDPAVADEFSTTLSRLKQLVPGGVATHTGVNAAFSRLLTPDLTFQADATWINRAGAGDSNSAGFDTTQVGLKGLLLRDDFHETLLSGGLGWGLPGGNRELGAHATIEPGIFFGRGFGDLPASLSALRPFAISGVISIEHPTVTEPNSDVLHWGASLQFSTLYLTDRFTPGHLPAEEPLFQWVPLVELSGDTPRHGKTSVTVLPGIAYVGDTYQIAAELIVPLNREAGRGVGAKVNLLLFIDDLVPSIFGKPVFGE